MLHKIKNRQLPRFKFRANSAAKFMMLSVSLLMLLIAGCSQQNEKLKTESPENEVELKFIWWGNDARKDITEQVIALCESQNPHVTIQTEVVSGTEQMAKKLAIYTARQEMPDIIQADYNFVFNYIKRDLLEPYDGYVGEELQLSNIDAKYLESAYWQDKLYAIPMGVNSQAFAYNEDYFKKAGVAVPEGSYSLDEFDQMLKKLKEASTREDFYPLGNMIDMIYFFRANGASIYNQAGDGLGFEDDSIMSTYLNLQKKWMDEGLLRPDLSTASVNDQHPLITGETAIYSVSTNNVASLNKLTNDHIKLLNYPTIKEGEIGNYIKPSMFLTVSSYSKHKQEAVKFVNYLTNSIEANEILNGERGVPISSAVSEHLLSKLDDSSALQYDYINQLLSNSKPIDPPNPTNHVVVNQAYENIRNNVLAGKITPDEGAKQYREQATSYLSNK